MARPLRIVYPGAIYHITSRGNARQPIYEDDEDRKVFLELLGFIVDRFNWLCHAYCLMDNHYHLLIETQDGNLSLGMHQLNGTYTLRFNKRHGRVGHLFQGRFKAILVDRENYLLELCRYLVLNSVRAGMVRSPGRYKWSSYHATVGTEKISSFLTTASVLSQCGRSRKVAQEKYKTFVEEAIGKPGPWGKLRGQILLGNDTFVASLEPYIKKVREVEDVPRGQRFVDRPGLEELLRDMEYQPNVVRDNLIREAHWKHGYTLVEIAEIVGQHYTTVSRIANRR